MKIITLLVLLITSFVMADTYVLSADADSLALTGQGTLTFPTATSFKYQHDGTVVPTSPVVKQVTHPSGTGTVDWTGVLDSVCIVATDAAGNVSAPKWIFIYLCPVNDNAPVITSDTLTCFEGSSVSFTPTVTDADN